MIGYRPVNYFQKCSYNRHPDLLHFHLVPRQSFAFCNFFSIRFYFIYLFFFPLVVFFFFITRLSFIILIIIIILLHYGWLTLGRGSGWSVVYRCTKCAWKREKAPSLESFGIFLFLCIISLYSPSIVLEARTRGNPVSFHNRKKIASIFCLFIYFISYILR